MEHILRPTRFISFFGTVCAIAIFSLFSHASGAQAAAYNPSNIIRDDVFTNRTSLNAGDIQNFLANNGSCLATVDPSLLGGSSSAANLIYDAAQSANGGQGINPQVILVTLQKEWSLVTKSCAQLDALYGGYGGGPQAYLKRGLGYNVPDVLGVGDCLYTFNAQLKGNTCSGDSYLGGPGSMRRSFSLNQVGPSGSYPYPQAFTVQEYSDRNGNVTISPQTKATSVLFRYTPYAYYGNYNFYNIFSSWFGNPACPVNMGIIKGSGPQTYAIKDGWRYYIPNNDVLNAWGMQCLTITTVSDYEVNTYAYGGQLSRVIKDGGDGKVYIVADGARRHINTPAYVGQMGISDDTLEMIPSAVAAIPESAPIGFLLKASGNPAIYLAQANRKYYVPNVETIESWGFTMPELTEVTSSYVDALPTAGTLTVLAKGSRPETFLASEKKLIYLPSPTRVKDWDLQNFGVTILDDAFINNLPQSGILTQVTRGSGTATYYVAGGTRKYLSTLSAANKYIQQYGPLIRIADAIIGRLNQSGVIK